MPCTCSARYVSMFSLWMRRKEEQFLVQALALWARRGEVRGAEFLDLGELVFFSTGWRGHG
jgi:hypothetical protein